MGQRSIFPVHRTDLVQALVLTYLHRMHPATVRRLKSLFKGKDAILASRKEVVDALQSGQYTILYDTLRGALEVQLALVKRGSQKPVSDAATRAAQAAGLLSPPRARPGTAGGYEYVPSRVNTAWTTTAAGDGALALTSAQMPTAPPEDALLTCLREFRSSLNHPSAAGLVLAKALCVASDTAPVRSQDMTSGRIEFDYWQPAVALARTRTASGTPCTPSNRPGPGWVPTRGNDSGLPCRSWTLRSSTIPSPYRPNSSGSSSNVSCGPK